MSAWLPLLLDLIIAGVALEAVALAWFWRVARQGVAPRCLLPNLGAGACLLVAVRVVLGGGWWGWMCLALLGALLLHLLDLRRRWHAE